MSRLLRVVLVVAVVGAAARSTCDVSASERTAWCAEAADSLSARGKYAVFDANLTFAPIGTISNPAGTYGVLQAEPKAAYPSSEFCACLKGDTTVNNVCNQVGSVIFSGNEDVCKGTFVLQPQDAVVLVGCTPPAVEYFGWQTNVLGRWTNATDSGVPGLFYPEVSPFDSIHQGTINTTGGLLGSDPWNRAFAVVLTGDAGTRDDVVGALEAAGVPADAVNVDAVGGGDVRLWDSSTNWAAQQPDTLEVIVRINGPINVTAVDAFLAKPQAAFVVRANKSNNNATEPLVPESRRARSITEAEASWAATYEAALDELVQSANATARAQGFALSFVGEASTTMNFGYEAGDVDACCLAWPQADDWWMTMIHFSTADCLYQSAGSFEDEGGSVVLAGRELYRSTEAAGPASAADLTYYTTWYCDDNNTANVAYECSAGCSPCLGSVSATGLGMDGCQPASWDNTGYSRLYCDDDGTPVYSLYLNDQCQVPVSTVPVDDCYAENISSQVNDTIWLSSYLRQSTDTVMMLVGAATNQLNASSFHNVYMPITSTYNDPDKQLDFQESDLAGTGLAWMPQGGDPDLFANLFVAQWTVTDSCLAGPAADDTTSACLSLQDLDMPDLVQVTLLSRQYLDPQTLSGPSKDLPHHRWLVFDRMSDSTTRQPPPTTATLRAALHARMRTSRSGGGGDDA